MRLQASPPLTLGLWHNGSQLDRLFLLRCLLTLGPRPSGAARLDGKSGPTALGEQADRRGGHGRAALLNPAGKKIRKPPLGGDKPVPSPIKNDEQILLQHHPAAAAVGIVAERPGLHIKLVKGRVKDL